VLAVDGPTQCGHFDLVLMLKLSQFSLLTVQHGVVAVISAHIFVCDYVMV
jgi:hypothetical protein